MKRLFVSMFLAMALSACGQAGATSPPTTRITRASDAASIADAALRDAEPTIRYEATTTAFCRPSEYETDFARHRALTRGTLTELANEGWEYQGIIHNDGINCSVVYFRRVARPPQPSIVDAGVTGG